MLLKSNEAIPPSVLDKKIVSKYFKSGVLPIENE
jgi:hypothetical protein